MGIVKASRRPPTSRPPRVETLKQNVEFRCPVMNLLRAAGVDLDVTWDVRRRNRGLGSVERRAYHGRQFADLKRLGQQHVTGPQQTVILGGFRGVAGHENDL